ncbi:MAG: efflux RND transporter permease subunit [Planctomycetota bacterium]
MSRDTKKAEAFWKHLEPLQGALERYCRRSVYDQNAVEAAPARSWFFFGRAVLLAASVLIAVCGIVWYLADDSSHDGSSPHLAALSAAMHDKLVTGREPVELASRSDLEVESYLRRQVYIPIYRQPGANTIQIVDAINDRLARILARLKEMNADDPKMQSLVLSVVMDQSVGVRKSIRGLQMEALLGALLCAVVVILFLRHWRLTLIILTAIPLSILAAIIGLFYTGDTLNAMTLGGMALAVGILIDQSIVVLENIVRHGRMGKSPVEAAVDGTREVAMAILVSTITFCIVFYPVVFLSGTAKFLFTPLAVSVMFAIVASYLVAIFFVPVCGAKLLAGGRASRNTGDSEDQGWLAPVVKGYGWLLRRTLRWKWTVLAGSVLIFAGSMLLFFRIGQELFPPVDSAQFTMYVRLPSGTRIENTEETITRLERVIIDRLGEPDPAFALGEEQHPDSHLQILISNIGVLMDWPAAYTPNTGPMDAFVLVQLKDKRGRPGVFDLVTELRRELRDQFPSVEIAFDTGGMMTAALNMGEPSPLHFQVTGSDLHTAQRIARIVKQEAEKVPGTADVRIAQRLDYPVLNIEMDRVLAAYQGVTVDDTMENVVSATNSSINFEPAFWIDPKNGNHYFLGVQYQERDINSLDTLRNIPITGEASVRPALLRNIASIEQATGPAVINHRNITRATDLYANVLPDYDAGTVVTGTSLNIQSLMGIIMMMGIVVEYSIVLLDFADHRVEEGASPEQAVYEAAIVRFRPILMTSVTTIMAMLPMAIGFSGSGADQSLAIAIVGGVAAATLLPKFVVPCMYTIVKRPPRAVAAVQPAGQ